jgi:hypothetical protein
MLEPYLACKKERNNDEYDMVFRMETIAQYLDYC